jgi:hypothetical protein
VTEANVGEVAVSVVFSTGGGVVADGCGVAICTVSKEEVTVEVSTVDA